LAFWLALCPAEDDHCDAHLFGLNMFWFCSAPAVRSYWFSMLHILFVS